MSDTMEGTSELERQLRASVALIARRCVSCAYYGKRDGRCENALSVAYAARPTVACSRYATTRPDRSGPNRKIAP